MENLEFSFNISLQTYFKLNIHTALLLKVFRSKIVIISKKVLVFFLSEIKSNLSNMR